MSGPINLLNRGLVQEAVSLVLPAIENVLTTIAKRRDGFLAVANPHGSRDNDPSFIFELCFGDSATWEHPFDEIAKGKARVSWRTGLNTRRIAVEEPYLYYTGDTKFVGGVAWGPSGRLVVVYSGAEDYLDELICNMVAASIQALSRREYANIPPEQDFPWGQYIKPGTFHDSIGIPSIPPPHPDEVWESGNPPFTGN